MLKILGNFLPGASGEVVGILLFTLGLALWIVIPFYDGENKAGSRGRDAHYFGLFAITALFMPPLTGKPEEIVALGDYLYAQSSPTSQQTPAPTLKAQK
jgi:hypothetical protein